MKSQIGRSMSIQHTAPTPVILGTLRALFQMMKPTISLLVVVTVVPSYLIAGQGSAPLDVLLWTLLGTYFASGSAGIFNHLADSDIDGYMNRTSSRPLPTGKVSNGLAAVTATALGILSFWILWQKAYPLTAWIALAANGFYVLFYTMYLKRRTVQNIVIGGAAGAVGPLIGYSALTGTLDLSSWILFMVIFLWTPPHFWALAIKYRDDYAKANIPMLPSVKGVPETKKQILLYTLTLVPTVAWLFAIGDGGWIYLVGSMALTLWFAWLALKLFKSADETQAMPLFLYSCFYLFGVFGFLAIDRMILL